MQRFTPVCGGHNDDNGLALFDQSDRTVFQLASGKTFGVDVADLFEFKRAFKGNREPNVAP